MMKQLASAEFRKKYTALAEPYEVTAHGKVIGTWTPFGSPFPEFIQGADSLGEGTGQPEVPQRMTIRPVKGPARPMVGTSQRVLDPLDAAKADRGGYSRFTRRQYSSTRPAKS